MPLSSKTNNKQGKLYYKFIDDKRNLQIALLAQIRIFDNKRKSNLISKTKNEDFEMIKDRKNYIIG